MVAYHIHDPSGSAVAALRAVAVRYGLLDLVESAVVGSDTLHIHIRIQAKREEEEE